MSLFTLYLSSPALHLIYKFCGTHSFNDYCEISVFCLIGQNWPVALWRENKNFIHSVIILKCNKM